MSIPNDDVLRRLNLCAHRLGDDGAARKKNEYYGNTTNTFVPLTIQKVQEAPPLTNLFFATRSNSRFTFQQLPTFAQNVANKTKFVKQLESEKDALLQMLQIETKLLYDMQIMIDVNGKIYHIDIDRIYESHESETQSTIWIDKGIKRCEELLTIIQDYVVGNATVNDLDSLSKRWGYQHNILSLIEEYQQGETVE